jgi:hypothetical protein
VLGVAPAAAVDVAEHPLHRELDRKDFFSGVDEALWWALGR